MKKLTLIVSIISILACITGCVEDETRLKATSVTNEEEFEKAASFVTSYKEEMVEAVDALGFDSLEEYLIPNTSFYHSLRRYISDLEGESVFKELIDFNVNDVRFDGEGSYFVDVNEHVQLTYQNGETENIERHVEFELVSSPKVDFRLVTIREFK